MVKKLLVMMSFTVVMVLVLVACSSDNNSGAASGDNVTLQVVWFSDGGEGASFERLATQYMEENDGIVIELIEVPFNELDNTLRNMLNAGTPPAIARMINLGTFSNQLVDLFDYVGRDFENNFGEGLQFVHDGRMIGAPMDITANGLIYNRTAFEQAGVSVPQSENEIWNWDEWKEAMLTVMENSDVSHGLVFDRSPHRFSTLLYQAGASLLNEDLSASNFNSAQMYRTVEFFKSLHDEGIIPSSVWLGGENPNNLFRTGQIAMHFAGSWMIANYREEITDFEWGVTFLPYELQRGTTPGGKYLSAFSGSGVEQEAADFIAWLSQPEINAIFVEENYFLSQVIGNEELNFDFGSEFFEIFALDLAATSSVPGREWGFQELTSIIQTDIRDGLEEVLAGQLSIANYLQRMDDIINDALAEINQ